MPNSTCCFFWCQVPKMEAKACNLRPLAGGNFTIKQSAQIVHCIQDYILYLLHTIFSPFFCRSSSKVFVFKSCSELYLLVVQFATSILFVSRVRSNFLCLMNRIRIIGSLVFLSGSTYTEFCFAICKQCNIIYISLREP